MVSQHVYRDRNELVTIIIIASSTGGGNRKLYLATHRANVVLWKMMSEM